MNQNYPLLDGSMVYQARAMYGSLFGYKYIFTDGCPKYEEEGEKSLTQQVNNSTQSLPKNEIIVYPNPNNGKFYMKINSTSNLIQIFDLQGRLVKFEQKEVDTNTIEFEIDAENGMYNVQVITNNTIENVKIKVFK